MKCKKKLKLRSKCLPCKSAGLLKQVCYAVKFVSILREVTAGAVLLSCFDNISSIDTHWAPRIRRLFICHSFITIFLHKKKDVIHGFLLSCWAKWGLVIGQRCTAGSVKFCEEKFNGNLFSSETRSTNMNVILIYLFNISQNALRRRLLLSFRQAHPVGLNKGGDSENVTRLL